MVIGQKGVNVVLVNVRGEIYNRLDSYREIEEENNQGQELKCNECLNEGCEPLGSCLPIREAIPRPDTHIKQELNKEISKDYDNKK